jgi:hypothetical protein
VLYRGVPGHFIECGCWRGGVALFAAAAFKVYGEPTNKFMFNNGGVDALTLTFREVDYVNDDLSVHMMKRKSFLADSFGKRVSEIVREIEIESV